MDKLLKKIGKWWSYIQTKQFRFIEWKTREDGGRIVFAAQLFPAWSIIGIQLSDWGLQIRLANLWLGFFMHYLEKKEPAAKLPSNVSASVMARIQAHEKWKQDRNITRVLNPQDTPPTRGFYFDLGKDTVCTTCLKRYCACKQRRGDGSWIKKEEPKI